jgi:hypothetical protein
MTVRVALHQGIDLVSGKRLPIALFLNDLYRSDRDRRSARGAHLRAFCRSLRGRARKIVFMPVRAACPEGVTPCNDVTAVSVLVPLSPVAAVLAFAIGWPLSRLLPGQPLAGWLLAVTGAAGYIVFSGGPILVVAGAFGVSVIGVGFALGRRASMTVLGTPGDRA